MLAGFRSRAPLWYSLVAHETIPNISQIAKSSTTSRRRIDDVKDRSIIENVVFKISWLIHPIRSDCRLDRRDRIEWEFLSSCFISGSGRLFAFAYLFRNHKIIFIRSTIFLLLYHSTKCGRQACNYFYSIFVRSYQLPLYKNEKKIIENGLSWNINTK